jgi:hypothetical protein
MKKNYAHDKADHTLPVIFIFDLDKTLIGESHDLMFEYKDFLTFISDGCKHKRFSGTKCELPTTIWNKNIVVEQFFRPHLKESLHAIKKIFPTAEFFVFSLGAREYVYDIISYLESYTGIKFNRPLFTREDSSFGDISYYMKEIKGYEDTIFKMLVRKYPKCKSEHFKSLVMQYRTVIIDDTNIWNNDIRWIQCKPYTYQPICEVDNDILHMIYTNESMKNYLLSRNVSFIPNVSANFDTFMMNYHLNIANLYRKSLDNNVEQLQDNFFVRFVKCIQHRSNKSKPFAPAFLKKIKNKFM